MGASALHGRPANERLLLSCVHTYGGLSTCRSENAMDGCDELVRNHDLWFSDGSIVLRAENVLFRVHISQLSRHSTVFADMLSFPQPTGSSSADMALVDDGQQGEKIDGCPVLFLHDKAEDVMNLLHALYDGPRFGDNGREDFRAVSGILRLANKYDIEKLRGTAVEHLSSAWPMTLRGWDSREDLARTFEIESGMQRGFRYPSPVAVINLAREVDAPQLLPSALYDLSRYHYAQIFGAGPGEDDHEPLGAGSPRASTLAHADLQKLAVGKEAAAHAVTWLIQSMAHGSHRESPRHLADAGAGGANQHNWFQYGYELNPAHHRRRSAGLMCTSASACRKDFSELVELATQHYLFDRERGCADPLYVAEELGQLKSAEFSECKACARSLEGWAARERERMWKLIPAWFRLV
ncbi:uncharacterized protein B0H18DRAFT_1083414 [Fomitopsis serialis]|uniref:uncharacterized protein n=1 Tax=Fomitopsis serialis TaxID=139415 RepID=UPI0020080777|nr:uncharacterized protein B0H18DRAFT_1083414 [Neoantrodia serialis]KAH9931902.1 hypothetical protein B0H18DRAFT_1083414 [Neoantrodia serialis]